MSTIDWNDSNYKPKIDDFVCSLSNAIFIPDKEYIFVPVTDALGLRDKISLEDRINLDCFVLKPKKCYHLDKYNGVKIHICRYMNYFELYYDLDKELLNIYAQIKYRIDTNADSYPEEVFIADLQRYILSDSMIRKVLALENDCFELQLKSYPSQNMALCYKEEHVRFLMENTVFSNMMIPIIMHYVYKRKILDVDGFTAICFNLIFDMRPDIDIHAKIQETVFTNVERLSKNDTLLWTKCAARGMNEVINAAYTIDNIILNVMPKYNFNNNPINMNIATIKNDIRYKVVEVPYEYDIRNLNSSNREGEDNASPYDKFESQCIRSDEALMLLNKVNAEYTMKDLINIFGEPSVAEINFYIKELSANGTLQVQEDFQRNLVVNLFTKYFGDTASIREIKAPDYVKLMIIGKRMLKAEGLVVFPEIFGGFVERRSSRNSMNKKEMSKLEIMDSYNLVKYKYCNDEKMLNYIKTIISTILTSDFNIIDFYNPLLNGVKIPSNKEYLSDIIMNEICSFIMMI